MYSLCIKDKRAKSQIRQIISSSLHVQTMTSERTGAIQLPKGEQHLWNHTGKQCPMFSGLSLSQYPWMELSKAVVCWGLSANLAVVTFSCTSGQYVEVFGMVNKPPISIRL